MIGKLITVVMSSPGETATPVPKMVASPGATPVMTPVSGLTKAMFGFSDVQPSNLTVSRGIPHPESDACGGGAVSPTARVTVLGSRWVSKIASQPQPETLGAMSRTLKSQTSRFISTSEVRLALNPHRIVVVPSCSTCITLRCLGKLLKLTRVQKAMIEPVTFNRQNFDLNIEQPVPPYTRSRSGWRL